MKVSSRYKQEQHNTCGETPVVDTFYASRWTGTGAVQDVLASASYAPCSWDNPKIWHFPQANCQLAQIQEDFFCSQCPQKALEGQQTAPGSSLQKAEELCDIQRCFWPPRATQGSSWQPSTLRMWVSPSLFAQEGSNTSLKQLGSEEKLRSGPTQLLVLLIKQKPAASGRKTL